MAWTTEFVDAAQLGGVTTNVKATARVAEVFSSAAKVLSWPQERQLGNRDSNPNFDVQSVACCHYTIPQCYAWLCNCRV